MRRSTQTAQAKSIQGLLQWLPATSLIQWLKRSH